MDVLSWQIGEVRVTRVMELQAERTPDFGYADLTTDDILRESWLKPHFATEEGKLISCVQAFVVEAGGRRIIVDTCVGNDKKRGNPNWNMLHGPFLEHLAGAGFPPDSIDVVLCTHLHVDHVGWNTILIDGKWVPTFPNATYLFGRAEWDHWSREIIEEVRGDITRETAEAVINVADVNNDSIRPVIDAGLHQLVEPDHVVTPEVRLEPTPGHTPGHVSVVIESGGQKAVITGDLMHHPIQCAMPHVASKFDHDAQAARDTRRDFMQRHQGEDTLVLGTHFAAPTAGHFTPHGDVWRFRVKA
ncbi:MBL fold metallo-hydrolase [Minwuia sp.]|uniref:MBL fold metallo-hydrolase n=1 Tax=Minwuia sp. TaxID=2493630 RepID=UPI003A95BE09